MSTILNAIRERFSANRDKASNINKITIEKNTVLNAISQRRTHYAISKNSPIPEEKVTEIIKTAVKYVPTAFNSQTHRAIVLFGNENQKLWDITKDELRKIVPAENFSSTEEKINGFQNSFGTVLYFEENSIVKGLAEQFPFYAHNFPIWNEVIADEVNKAWDIPGTWRLVAQMPFGTPVAEPGEKAYPDAEAFVKIYQ